MAQSIPSQPTTKPHTTSLSCEFVEHFIGYNVKACFDSHKKSAYSEGIS